MGERQRRAGLVLGGSGFLGAQVVRLAAETALEVTSAARHPGRAPAYARGRAREVTLDLRGEGALGAWLDKGSPAWIVNCAALASAAACEADPAHARDLNSELPRQLARWCEQRGARLVHVSTDLVFDGEPTRPAGYREEDEARPASVYGRTKLLGEQAALRAGALVVRLPLLFGDSGGRGLGASDSLVAAVARGDTPTLFHDERRTPLDVEEAAAALLELALGDFTGLLHVAGPRSMSRLELGLLALQASGRSVQEAPRLVRSARQDELDTGAPRPRDVSLNASLARSLLSTRLSWPEERLRAAKPPPG